MAKQGKVIGGASAGAIIMGPTLKYFESADDPSDAPEVIYEGLGLIDTVVIPHWANKKYGEIMRGIEPSLQAEGFEPIHITDDQAFLVDDATQEVV